jgi:hypothetical protein
MKILTSIAILIAAASLASCASRSTSADSQVLPTAAPVMKKADASCHNHAANSVTKSQEHCHKSPSADHSHKYIAK